MHVGDLPAKSPKGLCRVTKSLRGVLHGQMAKVELEGRFSEVG